MIRNFHKTACRIILGVFLLTFTVVACNNKGDKKEPAKDTSMNKMEPVTPMQDTTKMDTGSTRPTKPGD